MIYVDVRQPSMYFLEVINIPSIVPHTFASGKLTPAKVNKEMEGNRAFQERKLLYNSWNFGTYNTRTSNDTISGHRVKQ